MVELPRPPPLSAGQRAALSKSIAAGTFDPDSGMLVLRHAGLDAHVDRMEGMLKQRMDMVYNFAGLVAGHLPGRDMVTTFWRGDVGGSGALTALLRQNERLLQTLTPDIDSLKEPLNLADGMLPGDADAAADDMTGMPRRSALSSGGASALSSGSSGASPLTKPPPVRGNPSVAVEAGASPTQSTPPRRNWPIGTMLLWLLQQDNLSETKLRALDMLFYHGGQYVPAGAHRVYTPEASIELARKWLQLQRYFEIEGAGGGEQTYRFVDDEEWYPVFLDDSLRAPLLAARDDVWSICGHPEVALVDLMTSRHVRGRFSEMVAMRIKRGMQTVPTRTTTIATEANITMTWNAILNLFKTLYYTDAGELVFKATYNPRREEERRAREAAAIGSYGGGGRMPLLDVRRVGAEVDRERDRAPVEQSRMLRAFGAARHHIETGRRSRLVSADDL